MNKQEIQEILKKWKEEGRNMSFVDFLKANNLDHYLKTLDLQEYLLGELKKRKKELEDK